MMSVSENVDFFAVWSQLGFGVLTTLIFVVLALIFSSYIKIVTVLGILRVGLGVDSLPSHFVTTGLALVLSFFVMYPTLNQVAGKMDEASGVVANDKVGVLNAGIEEWKKFLIQHSNESEVQHFARIATADDNQIEDETSWRILAPAFVVSELKEAFATGLSLFLPFLVLDLLVANVLVAVGLTQMSPLLVSFPFKLLLFVVVDGWVLITSNLVATYS